MHICFPFYLHRLCCRPYLRNDYLRHSQESEELLVTLSEILLYFSCSSTSGHIPEFFPSPASTFFVPATIKHGILTPLISNGAFSRSTLICNVGALAAYKECPEELAFKAKAEKYAKIISTTVSDEARFSASSGRQSITMKNSSISATRSSRTNQTARRSSEEWIS